MTPTFSLSLFLTIVVCNLVLVFGYQPSGAKRPVANQFALQKVVKRAVSNNRTEFSTNNAALPSKYTEYIGNSSAVYETIPSTPNSESFVDNTAKEGENESLQTRSSGIHATMNTVNSEIQTVNSPDSISKTSVFVSSDALTFTTRTALSTNAFALTMLSVSSRNGTNVIPSSSVNNVASADPKGSATYKKSTIDFDNEGSSSASQSSDTTVSYWASLADMSSTLVASSPGASRLHTTQFLLPSFTLPSAFSSSDILSSLSETYFEPTQTMSSILDNESTKFSPDTPVGTTFSSHVHTESFFQGPLGHGSYSASSPTNNTSKTSKNHTITERSVDASVQSNVTSSMKVLTSTGSVPFSGMLSTTVSASVKDSSILLSTAVSTLEESLAQSLTSMTDTRQHTSLLTDGIAESTHNNFPANTSHLTTNGSSSYAFININGSSTTFDINTARISPSSMNKSLTSNGNATAPSISNTEMMHTRITSSIASAMFTSVPMISDNRSLTIPRVMPTKVHSTFAITRTSDSTTGDMHSVDPTIELHSTSSFTVTSSKIGTTVPEHDVFTTTAMRPFPEPETSVRTSEPDFTYTSPVQTDTTYPTSEPENEPDPEPETDGEPFAEPGPDWILAKQKWQEAWGFHVYFFGIAFAILGIYCVISVIALWKIDHLLSRNYFCSLYILVIIICVLRAIYILIDPYNSLGTYHPAVDYFIYSTVFPCLTSVFSILFYALLLATRVQAISPKIQKVWVLTVIIVFHFCLSFATDILVGALGTANIMLLVCQSFFIVWGLIMFIGYLILFKRLLDGAISRQQNQARIVHDRKYALGHGYLEKTPKSRYTLGLAVKITFASAFFGVACVGFELYGMFGVYGVLEQSKPQPWPWWTYHSIVRTLELLMCVSVAFVAAQPLKYTYQKHKDHRCLYLLPCHAFCSQDVLHLSYDHSYGSQDNLGLSERSQMGWNAKFKHKNSGAPAAPYPPHAAEKYNDPDATLLVRKVKQPKISMLVVEDGFVRIRREDELPVNQFDFDSTSRSSRSSDINVVNPHDFGDRDALNVSRNSRNSLGHVDLNPRTQGHRYSEGLFTDDVYNNDRRISDINDRCEHEVSDDTDIDIVVTESEHSDGDGACGITRTASNKSGDIFKPLSMIDLAASMESELDRAFHSGNVDNLDLISHNSLPLSLEVNSSDSNDAIYNERMYETLQNGDTNIDLHGDSDPADAEVRTSTGHITHPLVRRSKSAEAKTQKSRLFEKNRYHSVSDIEDVGNRPESDDDYTGCLTTEL